MALASTLGFTFEDMIIRVAEFLGVAYYGAAGGEAAQKPTDTHDLDMCKRLVNDGWRRFYNSVPTWNWMQPKWELTFDTDGDGPYNIDGDNWRYYCPVGFYGDLIGWFTYPVDGPRMRIDRTTEEHIRSLRASSNTSGYPWLFALRPIHNDPLQRWELSVFPAPSAASTVTSIIRIYPNRMVQDEDQPNCGVRFHEAVLASALYEAEMQKDDITNGPKAQLWQDAIARAVEMDRQTAPKRLGDYGGKKQMIGRRGWYTGVDAYGGTSIDDAYS